MVRFRTLMWQFVCLLTVANAQHLAAQTPAKPESQKESAVSQKESAVVVELLEKGQAPHRQLRFTPKAGDKQSKVMTTGMSQTISIGGQQNQPIDIPAQVITLDLETKNVNSNGDIDFEYRYVDLKVDSDPANPSPIATQMETMLKPLIGTKGTATITSRGLSKKADFEVPDGLNPMIKTMLEGMKDSLNQLSSPLPEEAVGVGGKWKTVQQLNTNGIKLKQTAISEVTSLDSNGFSLKVNIEQAADPQDVKNAMMPPGVSVKLESLATTGDGKSQFEFSSYFPKTSTVNVNSKTAMAMSIAGQNQKMATDMKMEMTLTDGPKK
jgi:hypothetical protein